MNQAPAALLSKPGPPKAAKIVFRVLLFCLIASEIYFYLWLMDNSPDKPDWARGLIFELPNVTYVRHMADHSFYVTEQAWFAMFGAISLTFALVIFGSVKGLIPDVFLDKRPEREAGIR